MKFIIEKEKILKELQIFQGILEKRSTMPILANILISVLEDRIEITGTDLEVGIKCHFPAKMYEKGVITISGKKLFEIVKSISEGKEVVFEESNDLMMKISAGDSQFKVLCLSKEDYPPVPEPKFIKNIFLQGDKVREMIEKVYFSITQEQRYYLNGALMMLKNDTMELVSTDGHRLAYTSVSMDNMNLESEIKGIVSKKTLGELKKFEDDSIEFDLDENNLFFRVGNRTLISRVIDGKFPNYEAVIPSDNKNIMIVSREEFTDAIRRVSLLSAERSRGVKFNIEKDQLRLFSSSPEIGEAKDKVEIDYDGEQIEVGFNSQYLLDFLSIIKSDKVRFELKDENSAVLIKPENNEEIEYKYVLMPMKI